MDPFGIGCHAGRVDALYRGIGLDARTRRLPAVAWRTALGPAHLCDWYVYFSPELCADFARRARQTHAAGPDWWY